MCCDVRNEQVLRAFEQFLRGEERSPATVEKYLRDTAAFICWLDGRPLAPTSAAGWRTDLLDRGYAPVSVNSMLAAVNKFLLFLGRPEYRARPLRLQPRLFREERLELTKAEYSRLLSAAKVRGRTRLVLALEAICATGIRVSELRCLTVEAVRRGWAEVRLKGKIRTILLPRQLCRKLARYAGKQKIASGEIFLTRGGRSLSRQQIWAEMKGLCAAAGVERSKVFPHNLRHLFARTFYRACRDITKLADVLGHSSINTTRIYLLSTGAEHARLLDSLGLVAPTELLT